MLEIERIETEMKEAAKNLDFERAMELRNALFEMKSEQYIFHRNCKKSIEDKKIINNICGKSID